MATKKSKSTAKTSSQTKKSTAKTATTRAAAKVVEKDTKKGNVEDCGLRGFFKRKYDEHESIMTIFRTPRIYGAMLAELIGVMLITVFFLSFGTLEAVGMNLSFQLNTQILFLVLGVTLVTFGISGANLNPIITAGMMATRRMSAIRGVLYMVAQLMGAWVGLLLVGAFKAGGGEAVEQAEVALPKLAEIGADTNFWLYAALGLVSAIVIGFFFARALKYRKSVFTFSAIVAGGVLVALLLVFAIQTSFFDYPTNYNLANSVFTFNNPAIAAMYQGFIPTSGAGIGEVLGQVGLNLSVFVVFPVIGSVAGFYLAETSSRLSGECCSADCKC